MKLTHEQCNEIFSDFAINDKRWIILIEAELRKAREKHPSWPQDNIHAAAVVAEEAGELVRSSLQVHYEKGQFFKMHNEAIQTGAMALRFLVETTLKKPMPGETKDREPKYQKKNAS